MKVARAEHVLKRAAVVGARARRRAWSSARGRHADLAHGPGAPRDRAARVEEPGLREPVTVRRDAYGIAHITAATPADLFFAQGCVHASERMWQMEVWRHISSGRLSELFGASQLDTDRFIRTLGWRGPRSATWRLSPPATRVASRRLRQGRQRLARRAPRLPRHPFVMTGADPEPWTDVDTLAWGKVQAWNLGGNLETRDLPVSSPTPSSAIRHGPTTCCRCASTPR